MDEYITRNNAISAVCFGCNQQFSNEPCEPSECTIRQSIMALPTADVAPKSAWISVDERLPEPLVDVLAFDAEGDIFIDFVLKSTGGFVIKGVTHWMPLPEPPKGE